MLCPSSAMTVVNQRAKATGTGLDHASRTALVGEIKTALDDDAVQAIVLTGAEKAFPGGTEPQAEFCQPFTNLQPTAGGVQQPFPPDEYPQPECLKAT